MNQSEYNAIPVGESHRELSPDDVAERGDELLAIDGTWGPCGSGLWAWPIGRVSIGHEKLTARFRRPING